MSALYDFKVRIVECDREGYYYPRWDNATPLTVQAATKQGAINAAVALMGDCPRGRGWYWGVKVDSAAPAKTDVTS